VEREGQKRCRLQFKDTWFVAREGGERAVSRGKSNGKQRQVSASDQGGGERVPPGSCGKGRSHIYWRDGRDVVKSAKRSVGHPGGRGFLPSGDIGMDLRIPAEEKDPLPEGSLVAALNKKGFERKRVQRLGRGKQFPAL